MTLLAHGTYLRNTWLPIATLVAFAEVARKPTQRRPALWRPGVYPSLKKLGRRQRKRNPPPTGRSKWRMLIPMPTIVS